jgi:hypothetical protein
MKTQISIMILAGAALAFGQQKTDTKPVPAKKTDSASSTVPAGAERVDAYTYRYTDAKGTTWIYRQTPFGYSKYEDPASAKAPAAASQSGVKLPADAQRIDDSSYRYRDAQGKTWIYSQTPFGFSRAEEGTKPQQPVQASDTNPVKVRDLGDSYEFVKTSPFGQSRWTRKKTDLNQDEREMVTQSQSSADRQESH